MLNLASQVYLELKINGLLSKGRRLVGRLNLGTEVALFNCWYILSELDPAA